MIASLKKLIGFLIRSFKSHFLFPEVEIGFGTYIARSCKFCGGNKIGEFCSVSNSCFGRYSYVGSRVNIASSNIGAFCSIASDVKIGLHEHPTRGYISTYPAFHTHWTGCVWRMPQRIWETQKNTFIGNDVWIGENVIVKAGTKVGDGAIIGAGSVVVKDVPPYAIVAGVPAKIIRFRMTEQQIAALETIRWWDWNDTDIGQRIDMFSDIDKFIEEMEIDKEKPLFSVVIPLFNKADTILRTLGTVTKQVFRNFEIVVVDDGSTDTSALLVETFETQVSLRLIKQSNSGVSSARNHGVAVARGKFVAFLDADDEWHPEFLLELTKIICKFPEATVVGTDYKYVKSNHCISGKDKSVIEQIDFFEEWPWRSPINSSSMAVQRDFFVANGGFNRDFRFYEDAEFLFRLAMQTKFYVSRRVLCKYNTDANNRASGSKFDMCYYPHWVMAESLIKSGEANTSVVKCVKNDLGKAVFGYARRFDVTAIIKLAKSYPLIFVKLPLSNMLKSKVALIFLYPCIICISAVIRMRIMSKIKIVNIDRGMNEV